MVVSMYLDQLPGLYHGTPRGSGLVYPLPAGKGMRLHFMALLTFHMAQIYFRKNHGFKETKT